MSPGDTYINKETPINTRDTLATQRGAGQMYKPSPMSWKGVEGELVVVDKVMIANNDEGSTVLKAGGREAVCVFTRMLCVQLLCTAAAGGKDMCYRTLEAGVAA